MDRERLMAHWQDEGDSAHIYGVLADLSREEKRRKLYQRLAEVERDHQRQFAEMLTDQGSSPGQHRPSLRARLMGWMARRGATGAVVRLRIMDEAGEVKDYLQQDVAERQRQDEDGAMAKIAHDEAVHARMLSSFVGDSSEPWHQMESGGMLRNVVYGFNDGLTANFGLVMGVIGASASGSFILISGIAGLVADALSMGSSGFLAAKSELEVHQNEIALEREELELMPEAETEELSLLYQARGMPEEVARKAAEQVMSDPQTALDEKVRVELGITGGGVPPLREGVITGIATAFGALIPVVPFFFGHGTTVLAVAFAISMLSHFGVGAARSFFTGRSVFRSGLDMFIVGMGVAIGAYLIGDLIVHFL